MYIRQTRYSAQRHLRLGRNICDARHGSRGSRFKRVDRFRGGWRLDRSDLYAMAGAQPGDIDFLQTYDDYPVIVMMQYEGHGLCAEGEGAEFVRTHTLDCEGTMPTNTSGGQLSMGQAGAAGGYLGLVETVRQLTDRPLGKAVPDANIGLVSGFGMITYDRCLCTGALILARSE